MRLYLTRLKCLFRDVGNCFWALIFPLCLGTFFYLGFGRLSTDSMIDTIKVYVASDYSEANLITQMATVTLDNDKPLFDVSSNYTKAELENYMLENKITGFLYVENNEITYRLNSSGMNQTIIKSFLDRYIQVNELIVRVSTREPEKLPDVIEDLTRQESYVEEVLSGTNPNANKFVIYFYALLSMSCMYASFWGIGLVRDIQADNSSLAARVNITPTHKLKLIINYALAALTVHFIGHFGLIMYLKYVLKVEFSHNLGLIVLTSFIGICGGIGLGAFLSVMIKGSPNKKEGIINALSLFLSFLSGLMFVDIKYLVNKYVPVLGYINPANLLTDSFYSLYYYEDYSRYFLNISILFVIALALIFGTYLKMRGDRYDSI